METAKVGEEERQPRHAQGESSTLDWRGRPSNPAKHGGIIPAAFILGLVTSLSLSLFLFASPPWWMHGLSLHICVYARVASIWDNGNSSSGKQPHNLCHQWHALSSLQGCQRCHQLCWNYLSPRSPRRLSLRLPPRQLLDHAHLWFSRTFCKPLPYFSSPLCITIATPTLSSTFFFLSPVLRTLMCCL